MNGDQNSYSAIDLRHYESVQIWGVAIHAIHRLSRTMRNKNNAYSAN